MTTVEFIIGLIFWSSGMAYPPTRRVSCPSRLLSSVCKVLAPLISTWAEPPIRIAQNTCDG